MHFLKTGLQSLIIKPLQQPQRKKKRTVQTGISSLDGMNVSRIVEQRSSKEPFYPNRVQKKRGEKSSPHTSRPTQVTFQPVLKGRKKKNCQLLLGGGSRKTRTGLTQHRHELLRRRRQGMKSESTKKLGFDPLRRLVTALTTRGCCGR